MSRRELHSLAKNLRQYLQWQAVPLSGVVPAPDEEHTAFQTVRTNRQPAAPKPVQPPRPPKAEKAPAKSTPKGPALWKDDSLSTGPRKTFAPSETASAKTETLADVREALGDCQRCGLCAERKHIVFGEGDPNARVMFVGEAPGFDEDVKGVPFVGKAGELLEKMIVAMTLSRETVYIANVIKCRPPSNRDPTPDEVAMCAPFLERQLAAIQPEVIVALGKFAANLLSGNDGPLSRVRGKWHEYNGVALMPTYHPAYLLRTPADKGLAWDDLKKVMERLDLQIPGKKS